MYALINVTNQGDFVAMAVAPDPVPGALASNTAGLLDQLRNFANSKNLPERVPGFLADIMSVLCATRALNSSVVNDFAIHMCWQYQLLPDPAKTARTAIMEKTFASHLGASWKSDLQSIDALDYYMQSLCIVPEILLEDHVRYLCMRCKAKLREEGSHPARDAQFAQQLAALGVFHAQLASQTKFKARVRQMLLDTAYFLPLSKYAAFVANAGKLLTSKGASGFFDLVDGELSKAKGISSFCMARRCDAFERAMNSFLDALPQPARYIDISTRLFRAQETFAMQMTIVKRTTIDALRAGVEMGDQNAAMGPRLLEAIEVSRSALDAQALPAYLRPIKPGTKNESGNNTNVDPNARALWPVRKLAEWIDGPIVPKTEHERTVSLERLQAEMKPSTSHGPGVEPSPTAPQATPSGMPGDQVKRVIQDALKKSSEFFLGDAKEMLERANALQIDEAQRHELSQLCEDLATLCTATEIHEDRTLAIFMNAERLGSIIRDSVKKAVASQRFQNEFGSALMAALAQEKVVFGKCTGGRVSCEAQDEDWCFAVNHFHNRWLSDLTVFAPDGVTPLELGADQAAVLYVTGSSKSGFAFDVSVHLWRRRRGSSAPPSSNQEILPPMDNDDWFDTYISCCVLHVPKRQSTTTTTRTTTSTAGRGSGTAQRGRGSRK